MAKRKSRIKILNVIIFLVILFLIGFGVFEGLKLVGKNVVDNKVDAYLASSGYTVKLYDSEFNASKDIVRGTKVSLSEKKFKKSEDDSDVYRQVVYEKKKFLVLESNVVDKYEDSVLEDKMYVRTLTTVYKDAYNGDILSVAKKGVGLEITGFDKLNDDGSVNMYKVKSNQIEGYVYLKYLVNTEDDANMVYDEDGKYQVHNNRGNTLGGGAAKDLDFYPVEKPKFENNVMPSEARTLYLNSTVLGNVDSYIKLAKDSNINAFVVDIKDNTAPAYPSKVMEKYSPTNYSKAINSWDNYKNAIKKLKDNGFYVIGRITVFKDSYYINDHANQAITSKSTGKPYNHNSSYWPSPYVRDVWEFNVKLAKEAVVEMGFNEIQFDYVRFPDRMNTVENQGLVDMKNIYGETKSQAIQGFLMYACDEIHKVNAYVSADVFGESANSYVTAYGQYWGAISNVVDAISGMPYPDHFADLSYGIKTPWEHPYTLLKNWGATVVQRQNEIPTPAIVRTWIQAYDAIQPPYTPYDANKVSDQIMGLYENGLKGGYITWNSSSRIDKYQQLAPAFRKSY